MVEHAGTFNSVLLDFLQGVEHRAAGSARSK
jgi:hypothetical protein